MYYAKAWKIYTLILSALTINLKIYKKDIIGKYFIQTNIENFTSHHDEIVCMTDMTIENRTYLVSLDDWAHVSIIQQIAYLWKKLTHD